MNITQLDKRFFYPEVVQVLPADDFKIYAYLNDGSVRLYDAGPLLKKGTVFEPLMNVKVFKEKLTVINDTIAWDMTGDRDPCKCIDIDPLTIFENQPIPDPLT